MDSKTKQLRYISKFAGIDCLTAIRPYLPYALESGASKEEIMAVYIANVRQGYLVHAIPQLKILSDWLDECLATTTA